MIKKKFMKKAAMVSMAAALSLGCYVECIAAAVVQPAVESEDDTRSARLVWYYKEENGKKYRRLYNATSGEWLTDWILCE